MEKKGHPTSPPPTWEDDPQASEGVMWGWPASPQQLLGRRCQGGQKAAVSSLHRGPKPKDMQNTDADDYDDDAEHQGGRWR